MKKTIGYILLIPLVIFFACDIKKNNEANPKGFFKIYNEDSYSGQFTPLDMEQTSDEGYLILCDAKITASSFPGIYVMKIDKDGAVQYTKLLEDTYVSAVHNLIRNGNEYYIVCMDRLNLGTYVLQLDETGAETQAGFMSDVQYPLCADIDPYISSNIIVQHYNQDDLLTIVSSITKSGTISQSRSFSIGSGDFDVLQPIIDHLTGNGKEYPFLCGRLWDNTLYFNGFYKYTFSLCMFDYDWDEEDEPALVQGYRDERCMSSAVPLSSNGMAASRFAYGDNYIMPYVEVPIESGAISTSSSMFGLLIPELIRDAPVCAKRLNFNGKDLVVYASTTKSSQVVLFAYDVSSGTLAGDKYLGATNPYKMAGFIHTADNGIAVLATTQVAGRFSRIAVFKLASDELDW